MLTALLEEAVLREFERIAARGGVLGAMKTGYPYIGLGRRNISRACD